MKYKVGDRVRIKSIKWYNENKDEYGYVFSHGIFFIPRMSIFCSCIMTINAIDTVNDNNIYYVEENACVWTEDMFEEFTDYKENMDYIEITLNDKNYIIDVKKAIELGVVKETYTRCKSWEEFKNKYLKKQGFFYNECDMSIALTNNPTKVSEQLTENEAIAIKAFSRLLKLRRDWVGNWDPDWSSLEYKHKYCIIIRNNNITIGPFCDVQHPFSFPTEGMAIEFLECFRNLFEQCKNLI